MPFGPGCVGMNSGPTSLHTGNYAIFFWLWPFRKKISRAKTNRRQGLDLVSYACREVPGIFLVWPLTSLVNSAPSSAILQTRSAQCPRRLSIFHPRIELNCSCLSTRSSSYASTQVAYVLFSVQLRPLSCVTKQCLHSRPTLLQVEPDYI